MNSELDDLLTDLSLEAENEQIISEIGALRSIYGDECISVWQSQSDNGNEKATRIIEESVARLEVLLELEPPHDNQEKCFKVLVSLRKSYPASSPPQLQLLSRYIGSFQVDSNLFGSVLRTYISSSGVEWQPGTECIFDGLENVREHCNTWYSEHLSEEKAHEITREEEKESRAVENPSASPPPEAAIAREQMNVQVDLPEGVTITIAEPIVDRKSIFIGRACEISHPSQVPLILSHLLADRRIARAAHPIINAWRCKVDAVVHQDNDDDGETAAGGRLAHLLQILDVDNVLIVVTRYFGGIHLGPDRFKHINQAARNALEDGGFLDVKHDKKATSRPRKRG